MWQRNGALVGSVPGLRRAWNTLVEAPVRPKSENKATVEAHRARQSPEKLSELDTEEEIRFSTGVGELDRVLGGGAVRGSVVLVGGAPGVGKSTLLLQLCGLIGATERVLYVTGEESRRQLKMRAQRLGVSEGDIYVLAETQVSEILSAAEDISPPWSLSTPYRPCLTPRCPPPRAA